MMSPLPSAQQPGFGPAGPLPSPRAQQHILECLSQFLAAESIDEGVDDGVAYDEGEEEVEVLEDAAASGVLRAQDDEQEVQEEGAPAEEENAQ